MLYNKRKNDIYAEDVYHRWHTGIMLTVVLLPVILCLRVLLSFYACYCVLLSLLKVESFAAKTVIYSLTNYIQPSCCHLLCVRVFVKLRLSF